MNYENPEWAQKLEEWGKDLEKKFDKKFEGKKPKLKPWEKKSDLVGAVIGNIVCLFIINLLPSWFPGFFTPGYSALLSVANLVIVIQIGINLLLLLFSIRWIYFLGQSAINTFGVVSMVTAIVIFPFNIGYGLDIIVRFGLTIGTVVTAIVGFVYLVKAFFAALNPLR